jgi:hypothetical protein
MLVSGTLLLEPHNHFQPEWPGSEPIAFLIRWLTRAGSDALRSEVRL